jgi:hypothetical protein
MTRICITGGPRTGKTTLAARLDAEMPCDHNPCHGIRHTDDLINLGWSEASEAASRWFDEPGPWIIEGVAVSRALRKWRDQHPDEPPPVDRVIYLSEPHETLTPGQATMAKGVATVHEQLADWLADHGVRTEYPMTAHQVPRLSMGGET